MGSPETATLALTIIFMIARAFSQAPPPSLSVHIAIWNRMPKAAGDLAADCSDHPTLGASPTVSIEYDINPYAYAITKFECRLTSVYGFLDFSAYEMYRDYVRRCKETCAWQAKPDGVYPDNGQKNDTTFIPWILYPPKFV